MSTRHYMKTLNNRGWSLGLMVTLLCVLFLFIIVIAIIFSNFKNDNPIIKNNETIENNF